MAYMSQERKAALLRECTPEQLAHQLTHTLSQRDELLAALKRAHWALDFLTSCTLLHGETMAHKLHFTLVCDEAEKARAALARVQS